MAPTVFDSVDSLLAAGPRDLGCTEWLTLDQTALSEFAAATLAPGAGGEEAAPPLLVLSLTNRFLPDLLEVRGAASGVNYGSGAVRFNAPARAGDRLRARAFLMDASDVPGGVQTTIQIRVEIEGSDEPACIVESLAVAAMSAEASRVVLVTGGARGLGKGLVDAFVANGDRVVACGRSHPGPGTLAVPFFPCDVRDPDQVAGMFDSVIEQFGRIDVAVNNAGGTPYAPAATMSPRLAERVIALNLLAPFYVAQRANAVMQELPEGGVVLNIGSTVAVRPSTNVAPYVAAKAGLVGLTRSLALEWAPKVRVNMVSPGLLRTELIEDTYGLDVAAVERTVPMGRFATAGDVAAACVMLASPMAGYVTGAELIVDGGGEHPAWLLATVRSE